MVCGLINTSTPAIQTTENGSIRWCSQSRSRTPITSEWAIITPPLTRTYGRETQRLSDNPINNRARHLNAEHLNAEHLNAERRNLKFHIKNISVCIRNLKPKMKEK